jgi:hypothetical protein
MFRRKSFAAVVAVIVALVVTVPVATAKAATAPAMANTLVLGPSSATCVILVGLLRGAALTANVPFETGLGYALLYNGCGGAAI